ncbi:hypothetical protein EH228_13185 [Erwinia endophytica]|uniref:hypothetical protein n=1 Tax=Erwinia endophytica TaxID=1563158 RepID=UPI001265F399|nr:hypothetical protein [Erwinia endophytica]KAB8309362.1 hypothetical protein EH228_13185 [Erwinia endophytica]
MIAKKIKVLVFSLLFLVFNICAQETLVQGPFKLKGAGDTFIRYVKNQDESISFVAKKKGEDSVIDTYEVRDGVPEIETVFFSKLSEGNNVVSLVSWDERNINEIHYKIYVYTYCKNGVIKSNGKINSDKHLEGYDGYNGQGSVFGLKDADSIRQYLEGKYK